MSESRAPVEQRACAPSRTVSARSVALLPWACFWITLFLSTGAFAQIAPAAPVGALDDVRFTQYSPLSANTELVRRLLTPLAAELFTRALSASQKALADEPIDLKDERFALYVPRKAPEGGYGLVVFIPPWPEAKVPADWIAVLDRLGVIVVTAARSGNNENVLSRRIPLALIAAQNVLSAYRVNPDQIYVSGFSGGSRVALHAALAFPDLFRGAFLDAGTDPIGGEGMTPPPKTPLLLFQDRSQIQAVSGSQDTINMTKDIESAHSLERWCAFAMSTRVIPFIGHVSAGPDALFESLNALRQSRPHDAAKVAVCRAALETRFEADIERVEVETAAGRLNEARKQIYSLDQRYGGFAEDRLVKLADRCLCGGFQVALDQGAALSA